METGKPPVSPRRELVLQKFWREFWTEQGKEQNVYSLNFAVYDFFIQKIKSLPQAEERLVDEEGGTVVYYVKNKETGNTVRLAVPMLGTENFKERIEKLFQDFVVGFGVVTLVDWIFEIDKHQPSPTIECKEFYCGCEEKVRDQCCNAAHVPCMGYEREFTGCKDCTCPAKNTKPKLPTGLKAAFEKTVTFGFTLSDDYRIKEWCDKLKETLVAKHNNYGNSALKSPQFANCSVIDSLFVRYGDKINRLKSLRNGEPDKVGESIKDTVLDIAGYSILILMAMEENQK